MHEEEEDQEEQQEEEDQDQVEQEEEGKEEVAAAASGGAGIPRRAGSRQPNQVEPGGGGACRCVGLGSPIRFHDSSGSVFTGCSEVGGQQILFMSWELDMDSRCSCTPQRLLKPPSASRRLRFPPLRPGLDFTPSGPAGGVKTGVGLVPPARGRSRSG